MIVNDVHVALSKSRQHKRTYIIELEEYTCLVLRYINQER